MLHLQDLVKSFDQQIVLNHVSFELQLGEIIGLIGPSGAGKSTMIKTTLGMEKADGGLALVLNHTMPNRHILGDIGYMAQSDALYESLSGQENLEFFGQLKGLSKKRPKGGNCSYSSSSRSDRLLKQGGIRLFWRNEATLVFSHRASGESSALDFGRTDSWNRPFSSEENLERIIRA